MPRKLYSLQTELRVLRTICEAPESRATQEFLAKLTDKDFASTTCRDSFRFCMKTLKKSSKLPSWDDLATDPNIDETVRDVLEACDHEPIKSKERVLKTVKRLAEYRKLRMLNNMGRHIAKLMDSHDAMNIDDQIGKIQNYLNDARDAATFKVLRIGQNSNLKKYLKKLLNGTGIEFIPTGFDGFDKENRGIPRGRAMLIASPTGNGKSAMVNQLAENFAKQGAKVGTVPLEMDNMEMLMRSVARISDTDMTKLLDPTEKLSEKEREEIFDRVMKEDRRIGKLGGSIEFYEFDEAVTIETLTSSLKSLGLDVLIIDYIGLLDGTSDENQWRILSDIIRFLHIWGKANGITTVSVAQLSEEGMLRYSKGMAEHAKFFWHWKLDEAARATGVVPIIQRKARNAKDHTFMLLFDLAKMTVKDADENAIKNYQDFIAKAPDSKGKGKGKKEWKEDELGWGDEADVDDLPKPKPGKNAQDHVKKKKKSSKQETEI